MKQKNHFKYFAQGALRRVGLSISGGEVILILNVFILFDNKSISPYPTLLGHFHFHPNLALISLQELTVFAISYDSYDNN